MELRCRCGRTCTLVLVSRGEMRHRHRTVIGWWWPVLIRIAHYVRITKIRPIAISVFVNIAAHIAA